MKVVQFRCNEFAENCFIAYDEISLDAIIIDPGMKYAQEWDSVRNFISNNKLAVRHILLTHYHLDHILGTGLCSKEYNIDISGSLEDMLGLPSPVVQARMFGMEYSNSIIGISKNLKEGDVIQCVHHKIQVIDCPGHSHHGLCYYFPEDKILFTGDVLFYCSIGRSDFGEEMGGNGQLLVQGIVTKLLTLPSDVIVYPGHGPQTSIGKESTFNPYI